ncbi:serine hydrolase [Candidatus Shapirobacteria bacterium]|nr:serine hydrolase [Candidatus Shapirobacteria bacterium]
MKKSSLFIVILTAFVFLILGYILGKSSSSSSIFSERRHQGSYKFINPLLECDSSVNFSQNASLSPLKTSLEKAISELQNNHQLSYASIYFRDLNNGPWLGINEKENFSPASLIKLPLAIAYFKEAEKNPALLQESIEATISSKIEKQSILPRLTLSPDQKYTIDELIRRMIVYSDNQAYEILLNHIDNPLLVQTFTDLGIDISAGFTNPSGNIITVKSYAAFFRVLFNASYLNQEMSEKLLSSFSG